MHDDDGTCEQCGGPMPVEHDRGYDIVCAKCAECADDGPSDHAERMRERHDMGLTDF